jgi:hypothetical protein
LWRFSLQRQHFLAQSLDGDVGISRTEFDPRNVGPSGVARAQHFRAGAGERHQQLAALRGQDQPRQIFDQLQRLDGRVIVAFATFGFGGLGTVEEAGCAAGITEAARCACELCAYRVAIAAPLLAGWTAAARALAFPAHSVELRACFFIQDHVGGPAASGFRMGLGFRASRAH